MKQFVYDILRPVYSPITTWLRTRLGSEYYNHPELELPKAYDAIQLEVERRLHRYLHCDPCSIENVVIVGANTASEISRIKRAYPNSKFFCFEPSPKYIDALKAAWTNDPSVRIYPIAVSDTKGSATFYELDMPGNGSLLPPDVEEWAKATEWKNKETQEFTVEVDRLDAVLDLDIDLLWIDTQGNELRVLQGAEALLQRTKAVFLEMTLLPSFYQGGAPYAPIRTLLEQIGFHEVGVGIDPWNFTGVGLYVSEIASRTCKEHEGRK